jgi:hypothetical protein
MCWRSATVDCALNVDPMRYTVFVDAGVPAHRSPW